MFMLDTAAARRKLGLLQLEIAGAVSDLARTRELGSRFSRLASQVTEATEAAFLLLLKSPAA